MHSLLSTICLYCLLNKMFVFVVVRWLNSLIELIGKQFRFAHVLVNTHAVVFRLFRRALSTTQYFTHMHHPRLEQKIHTNSSSLRVARGTADVKPALRFVAAIVWITIRSHAHQWNRKFVLAQVFHKKVSFCSFVFLKKHVKIFCISICIQKISLLVNKAS